MQDLLREIVRRCEAGQRVALCVVVGTRGSTPQQSGAKMLVTEDGRALGTLGGGCVEAEVKRRAIEMLQQNASQLLEFRLDHDYGWDDGLICGGIMDVHIQSIQPGQQAPFVELLSAMQQKQQATLRISYQQSAEQKQYTEPLKAGPMLVLAGAGHVAQAVAELAARVDFRITVIDDREDFASESRFPQAERRIVGPIEQELRRCGIDADSFVVIVTRGHHRDGAALHAVIDTPARYIGMIGSKRKIKTIFDDLHAQGVSAEKLTRVHAPIGLDLGAVSVNEIAVSIVAELIATRHGHADEAVRPMRIEPQQLRQWLDRAARSAVRPPQEHL